MAAPLVIAAAVGASLKIGGGIYGGLQAKRDSKKVARSLEDQARLEEEAGQFEALQTARQFDSLLGDQKITVAASGAETEGSVLNIFDKTLQDKKESVDNILAAARARAAQLRDQAKQAKKSGRRALISSLIGAGGDAATSYANYKSMGGGKETARAGALNNLYGVQ